MLKWGFNQRFLSLLLFHQVLLKSLDYYVTNILSYIGLFFNKNGADSIGIPHRIGLKLYLPQSAHLNTIYFYGFFCEIHSSYRVLPIIMYHRLPELLRNPQ